MTDDREQFKLPDFRVSHFELGEIVVVGSRLKILNFELRFVL